MFDLLVWKYEYEPYDLNGWIPDFCILEHSEILVEVKPNSRLEELDIEKLGRAIAGTEKEGREILLFGSTIFERTEAFDHPAIGWLGEYDAGYKTKYWFAYAVLNRHGRWGFFHEYGSYADRITSEYDGDRHKLPPSYDEVLMLWNTGGNTVQWRAPA